MSRSMSVLLAGLTSLTAQAVSAAEGRVPIPFEVPITFPITIDTSGYYVVTRNLTNAGTGSVIAIDGGAVAIEVVLDLNGMTLDNSSDPAVPAVDVLNADVTILNGLVVGGQVAIQAADQTSKAVIDGLTIRNTAGSGMRLTDVDSPVVRNTTILNTASFALEILGTETKQATIEGNVLRGTSGISLSNVTGARVWNNRIEDSNARPPIELIGSESCLVGANTISTATGVCIRLEDSAGNQLLNNLVSNCTGHGIELFGASDGNSVEGNVLRGGGDEGIRCGGQGNRLEGNQITGNASWGIHFDATAGQNVFGRNVSVGNGGTACGGGGVRVPELCDNSGPLDVNNRSFGDNLVPPSLGLF